MGLSCNFSLKPIHWDDDNPQYKLINIPHALLIKQRCGVWATGLQNLARVPQACLGHVMRHRWTVEVETGTKYIYIYKVGPPVINVGL